MGSQVRRYRGRGGRRRELVRELHLLAGVALHRVDMWDSVIDILRIVQVSRRCGRLNGRQGRS